MVPSPRVRLIETADAGALTALQLQNRRFLAPWEPRHPENFFSLDGQSDDIRSARERHDRGEALPLVILDDDARVAGRVTLSGIVRRAFLSCSIGYWVAEQHNGRGYATDAVTAAVREAFEVFDLHRVEAGTLVHNRASQRVLERAGFTRFGIAPRYLRIDGDWQDHVMFQRLNE